MKDLIELIDDRIKKEKTQYSAMIISVQEDNKKATVNFPGNSLSFSFLNKTGEFLLVGDSVYIFSDDGDLTNGVISRRFGEASWASEKFINPVSMTTAEKNSFANPIESMIIYDSTLQKLCLYTTTWETITSI